MVVTPRSTRLESIGEPVDTASRLAHHLADGPEWMADALCKEYPHVDFVWGELKERTKAECLQVCGRCLVRVAHLRWALADPPMLGVLGGTDTAARKAIRANRDRQAGES